MQLYILYSDDHSNMQYDADRTITADQVDQPSLDTSANTSIPVKHTDELRWDTLADNNK
jgi:hypothetical protein